jgi:DNA-binding MarR family transcriptional regulator
VNDEDVTRLRGQLSLLQRRLRREVTPVEGLSRPAIGVLAAIARLPESPRPRQVADELRMTSSNVAAALRELERHGFVRRDRDPADARGVRLRLSDSGAGVVRTVHRERDTWLGRAIEELLDAEEQRTLLAAGALLERLAGHEERG